MFKIVKRNLTGWLEQEYWCWGGFEMQYAKFHRVLCRQKGNQMLRFWRGMSDSERTRLCEGNRNGRAKPAVEHLPAREEFQDAMQPKLLIEPLMRENPNNDYQKIQVYCFNGIPKITVKIYNTQEITVYDENLNITEDIFDTGTKINYTEADDNTKLAVKLSCNLTQEFKFVRLDWFIYKNNLYFEEFTFTPHSGFYNFKNNLKLGKFINLERMQNGLF